MMQLKRAAFIVIGLIYCSGEAAALEYVVDCAVVEKRMRQVTYELIEIERFGATSPEVGENRSRLIRELGELQGNLDKAEKCKKKPDPEPMPPGATEASQPDSGPRLTPTGRRLASPPEPSDSSSPPLTPTGRRLL